MSRRNCTHVSLEQGYVALIHLAKHLKSTMRTSMNFILVKSHRSSLMWTQRLVEGNLRKAYVTVADRQRSVVFRWWGAMQSRFQSVWVSEKEKARRCGTRTSKNNKTDLKNAFVTVSLFVVSLRQYRQKTSPFLRYCYPALVEMLCGKSYLFSQTQANSVGWKGTYF